ncbi:hypothetical protein M9H77_12004 [Catharanthus roseus]|uniref:Uncharacterized protein n=1 Tax=Catharanthus roseus TaxID=4058 RepID=A0ACC0BG91_CATRO|nr:hypothetical protein M9H77_12004 [Catharanthus roseus]
MVCKTNDWDFKSTENLTEDKTTEDITGGYLNADNLSTFFETRSEDMKHCSIEFNSNSKEMFHIVNNLQSQVLEVQRSRYENLIITLVHDYAGFPFYLPAFIDFRGRIYRSEELLIYLSEKLPRKTYSIFDKILSRTLTKSIFMPLIYGKSPDSMSSDIEAASASLLDHPILRSMSYASSSNQVQEKPVWIQIRDRRDSRIRDSVKPIRAYSHGIKRDMGLKNKKLGSRIKPFRLIDAITHSLKNDIRLCIALCAMLGFPMWWGIAPEPLLLKPESLTSPDIYTLYIVMSKDWFSIEDFEDFRRGLCCDKDGLEQDEAKVNVESNKVGECEEFNTDTEIEQILLTYETEMATEGLDKNSQLSNACQKPKIVV